MMDYRHRTRLKLLGHARVLDAREHSERVTSPSGHFIGRGWVGSFLIAMILEFGRSRIWQVKSFAPDSAPRLA